MVGPEFAGDPHLLRVLDGYQRLADPSGLGDRQAQQADGTATEHRHPVARPRAGAFDRPDRDRQRLHQRPVLEAHLLRKFE